MRSLRGEGPEYYNCTNLLCSYWCKCVPRYYELLLCIYIIVPDITTVSAIHHSFILGRYWANITDTVISGKFIQWPEGTTRPKVFTPGETVFHGVGEAAGMQWVAPFWAVEYGRGFIPSTLGFALSDSLFSTQDLYSIYRTLRVYSIALAQEILQGNL